MRLIPGSVLLVALVLAPFASAGPGSLPHTTQAVPAPIDATAVPDAADAPTPLAAVADGLQGTGSAIGRAAGAVGQAIGRAAAATARLLGDALGAIGHGLALAGAGLWHGLAAASGAALAGFMAVVRFLADTTGALAGALRDAPVAVQAGAAAGTAATAAGIGAWRAGWLRKMPLLLGPLYARIAKEKLLDHAVRSRLYDRIRAHPGTHASELARELAVPWGTLLHHLDKLEHGALVTSDLVGGKKCYFLPGTVPAAERQMLPALKNGTARRIAAYFVHNAGASQSDAARDLALSAAIVSWHVQRLAAAGVLQHTRTGRSKAVTVGPAAEALLASA